MKELSKIVAEADRARAAGKSVALATVIGMEGSGYRLPGARMLIADGKWVAGSISGGCLEDDVILRAREAVDQNAPSVAVYDTTSDEDLIFGVGLGCKGVVSIFIEPLPRRSGFDFIDFARELLSERGTGVVATVVESEGTAVRPGDRMAIRSDTLLSSVADAEVEAAVRIALGRTAGEPALVQLSLKHGSARVFVERIEPPTPLVVFGAGHDAMPVVRMAKELGWHVTLVDHRPAYATRERFPDADRVIAARCDEALKQVAVDRDTLALVMTHSYQRDLELLERLLPSPASYIGLLGPRRRMNELLADLARKDVHPTSGQRARLYAPVGLDLGGESPAEVALSMLSEMQAVLSGHDGGHLRDRGGRIHMRDSEVPVPRRVSA